MSGMVTLTPELLPNNSVSFENFCAEKNIPLLIVEDINNITSLSKLKQFDSDYILSTWPKILSNAILSIPRYFTIGSHPTPLPMSRGRHPLHWLICLGIPNTALTFFRMDNGIDTGSILLQKYFPVGNSIHDANSNMSNAAKEAIFLLVDTLTKYPEFKGTKQEENYSNYWRKKDIHDITLDPRMSASMALRIVNSFSPPYPGAVLIISREESLRILSGSIVSVSTKFPNWKNYEHGYIFYHSNNEITLRFDDAVLSLIFFPSGKKTACEPGKKIRPPSFYS
ncbi:MAG: methionyl-tRNA formyltransferase [Candidatus Riflebacteria bacterium]|nr:methionyl-tRNA formyltransferase [Candidatus Riflebacteria bacterium]